MEPQAVIDLATRQSPRSLAGHLLALGTHIFIFGALAYLTFLNQGGIAGQLLVIYVSALPVAFAIETLVAIRQVDKRFSAHHVARGCLTAVLVCGFGGVWIFFREQILLGLLGSLAVVWVTKYSPAAEYLRPPTLGDLAASTPLLEHKTLRTWATVIGALVLFVVGIGLTGSAVVGQMERPGGISFTIG